MRTPNWGSRAAAASIHRTNQLGCVMDKDLVDFVSARFAEAHRATPSIDYASWCRVDNERALPKATLGYRVASDGPLFLEAYTSEPIEKVVSSALGRAIGRSDIVEIGCLAAERSPALVKLWREAAEALCGRHEIAVATLTRPLRTMLSRIGVPLVQLVRADPAKVADSLSWGSYYELDPVVCAGSIAVGAAALEGFAGRGVRP